MLTVGIIGTRGIPNRYGGFERFVELLVDDPRWVADGIRFVVYSEEKDGEHNAWTTVRSVGCTKRGRPFWYYFRSAFLASEECDVVLCCGAGLSIFSFWPRLRGKALIVNPDGCEWRRTKWSTLGRTLVWALYAPAIIAANRVVIDAEALRSDFNLGPDAWYIPYAAPEPRTAPISPATRDAYSLHRPYALVLARLEPENNIGLILDAYEGVVDPQYELVIIGSTTTRFYYAALASRAGRDIRFLGSIYDVEVLDEIRSSAAVYLHGHSVGGTNPSLLEALATVTGRIFCHDNKYNREVAGTEAEYFSDREELTKLFERDLGDPFARKPTRDQRFHPDTIYERYRAVFRDAAAAR